MRMYGPELLHHKIATKEDLSQLVVCTEKLPDPYDAAPGSVMILTDSQQNYVATHIYKCVEEPEVPSPLRHWLDLGSYGPLINKTTDESLKPHCGYDFRLSSLGESWFTGYLEVDWKPIDDTPYKEITGELVYEVLVRKIGGYPENPEEGAVIVRAPKGTEYTEDAPYKFDDEPVIGSSDKITFHYRLFHVFASGWWLMTDGPVMTINE